MLDVVVRRGEDALEFYSWADHIKVEKMVDLERGEPTGNEYFRVVLEGGSENEWQTTLAPKGREVIDIYGGGTKLLTRVMEKKATWMARS
jgi:hypothetical protein